MGDELPHGAYKRAAAIAMLLAITMAVVSPVIAWRVLHWRWYLAMLVAPVAFFATMFVVGGLSAVVLRIFWPR